MGLGGWGYGVRLSKEFAQTELHSAIRAARTGIGEVKLGKERWGMRECG